MYSSFQLARKYFGYYFSASNGRGHGIHSPFVYDFVKNVLNDKTKYPAYSRVEGLRRKLKKDGRKLDITDLGAGSASNGAGERRISDITRYAAKPKRLGQLIFRIARYYQPRTLLELGTSLGVSTAYLAEAAPEARLVSIEGASALAGAAAENLWWLGLSNVELRTGNFDELLGPELARLGQVDLAFVDGNHRREPTLRYFHLLAARCSPRSVLIFDDIHWSTEMEEAWESIRQDPRVMLTIDLFFIGLVFFREEFKIKQNFTIRAI